MKKYNIQTIHKPSAKLKSKVCNMKEKIHPLDKVGAVYQINCGKHKELYIGETNRALKKRGYDHRVVTHKNSEESYTLKKDEQNNEGDEIGRKSRRNIKKKDYKAIDSGRNIIMTEGETMVSKHMALMDHEEGEVKIEAITYEENWFDRGVREAIEIKKKKPTLNEDEGRYHLSVIYDTIFGKENMAVPRSYVGSVAETT